jgi:hypothetical protein
MDDTGFAVENLREQTIGTRFEWSFQSYLAIMLSLNQARRLGFGFKITTRFQVRACFHHVPDKY